MMAGNESAVRYWWNFDPLGGGPPADPDPDRQSDGDGDAHGQPDGHADPDTDPGARHTLTFTPSPTRNVKSDSPTKNYGTDTTMRVRKVVARRRPTART